MKEFALEDSNYRSHKELQAAIARYLTWRNGDRDIAINPPPRRHVRRRAAYPKRETTSLETALAILEYAA
jgi:hypothetical protein